MFQDLTSSIIQPLPIDANVPEIVLTQQTRKRIQAVFEKEEKSAKIYNATSMVQLDNNYVFFSNHWFYLAVLCRKYAMALYPYCKFFDEKIRSNQNLTRDLNAGNYNTPQFSSLFENDEDKQRMIKFIAGGNDSRPGKALLNSPDGIVRIRSCKDIFGSCILKKLAVPDASSTYLGTLVYYLVQHDDLYADIEAEINRIIQNTKSDKETVIINTVDDHQYTIDELSAILKEMYTNAKKDRQVSSIHMFAFKYGKYLVDNYSKSEIIAKAGLNASYQTELTKGKNIYRSVNENEYGVRFYRKDDSPQTSDIEKNVFNNADVAVGGENKIFYGAPGCGKSRYVSDILKSAGVKKENVVRVTFHPEYSNVDFIGQILPTIETDQNGQDVVKYIFNPGSLSLALLKAYNTNDMVYLIIEEINRGNAAAIFGDMFQLLDRIRDKDRHDYSSSEYPVSNPNMQKYLIEKISNAQIRQRLHNGIFIPSNLTILATMNSSDQNVFTLDTAFKRRWNFEQISNDINKDVSHSYKNWYVPGTDVTWARFLTKINDEIMKHKIHNQTNEDKRLGKYFVTQECLTKQAFTEYAQDITVIQKEAKQFAYKVLEYIWNDVSKIGREEWFDTEKYQTLEQLIEAFVSPEEDNKPLSVFRNITF